MDRETRKSIKEAIELELRCGCDDPPRFKASREGLRKAESHQEEHTPKGAEIRFIYPDD